MPPPPGPFPSAAWPLNRSEAGAGYAALEPWSLGVAGCLLPVLPSRDRARWHAAAAAAAPGRQPQSRLVEPRPPVVLRPSTRIPGFLQTSKTTTHQEMSRQFRRMHGDLGLPYELMASMFREAAASAEAWDDMAPVSGNIVACCRPVLSGGQALQDADERASDTEEEEDIEPLLLARHRKNVRPGLAASSGEPRWSSHREWALYAGGECNSELWALPLPAAEDGASEFPSLSRLREGAGRTMASVETAPAMEFTTPIRQIAVCDGHPGFACVRTDSMATVVEVAQSHCEPDLVPQIEIDIAGVPYSYDQGDRWTCHMSWNPWVAPELALASGTGCIRLWDCAVGRETLLKDKDPAGAYDIQWNSCEYWNSPRQLLCANPDTLSFVDARAGASLTPIMSLKESPYAYGGEAFTAICPSALHPLHAVAASTRVIRVFDQRYLRQPVAAWTHGCAATDPPVFLQTALLQNQPEGRAACILAAAKESSRIYGYVYGQGCSDEPYTSLDQLMLRPTAHTSSVSSAVQDAVAIDPHEHCDVTSGFTFLPNYPNARLAGFSFRGLGPIPPSTGSAKGSDSLGPDDAVCVCLDESGAVIGHHIVVPVEPGLSSSTTIPASPYTDIVSTLVWNAAYESEGAVIDGMNLLFQTKATRDRLKEESWACLRRCGEAYERIDMTKVRQWLEDDAQDVAGGSDANADIPDISPRSRKALEARLRSILARNTPASEILGAVAGAASTKRSEAHTRPQLQPSYTRVMRNRLLDMADRHGLQSLPDIVDAVCSSSADSAVEASRADGTVEEEARKLRGLFSSDDEQLGAGAQAALAQAAADIALCRVRLQLDTSPDQDDDGQLAVARLAPDTAGPRQSLDSKRQGVGSAAQLLGELWDGGVADGSSQIQASSAAAPGSSRLAKRRTRPSSQMANPVPPVELVRPSSGAPMLQTAPAAPAAPADVFASSQRAKPSTQPARGTVKRKRPRKSGF